MAIHATLTPRNEEASLGMLVTVAVSVTINALALDVILNVVLPAGREVVSKDSDDVVSFADLAKELVVPIVLVNVELLADLREELVAKEFGFCCSTVAPRVMLAKEYV